MHDNFNNVHGFFKLPSCCVQDTIQFHFWATELKKKRFSNQSDFWMTQSEMVRSHPIRLALVPDLKEKNIFLHVCKPKACDHLDISKCLTRMFIFYLNICHCEDLHSFLFYFLSTFQPFIHLIFVECAPWVKHCANWWKYNKDRYGFGRHERKIYCINTQRNM